MSKRITNLLSNFAQLLETWISSRFQNVSQQSFKPSDLVEIVNRWSIRCNNSQRKPDHENTRLIGPSESEQTCFVCSAQLVSFSSDFAMKM